MATTDARPIPIKNVAYRVLFPIMDKTGTLITSPGTLAATLIKDITTSTPGGTVTQISTTGMYYLDLTNTEMNADAVTIVVTSTATDARATPIVLYPQESGDILVDVQSINADATSAANLAKTTRAIGRGIVGSGSSTTSIVTSGLTPLGAAADQFKGRIITFDATTTTTALRGQATDITASSNAANPTFTVTALTTAPVSGDTFSVT